MPPDPLRQALHESRTPVGRDAFHRVRNFRPKDWDPVEGVPARFMVPMRAKREGRLLMKAWRCYGFDDMRLEEVSLPVCKPGHVLAKILCVQPSVTEVQLARGIRTLAYDQIKKRLETEAPVQLFGH